MLHQIGVGALGPVFRTYEPTRDRLVAVKVFRLDVTPEQAQSLADELARAANAGLFHPSIVEPVAAGLEGTVAYRAEEYVAAESLDIALRHYAPATLDKALPFISQLASAIDFARAAGVGHGALHPRDIFVTPDEARATGFGVVDALDRLGLRAPVRRPYSPPERIAGSPWSTTADVFSLGVIAFELLTGRRPSGLGADMGALTGAALGDHEAAIRAVLARAMHEDPAERFATATAFASELGRAAGTGEAPAPVAGVAGGATEAEADIPLKLASVSALAPIDVIINEPLQEREAEREAASAAPASDLEIPVESSPMASDPGLPLDNNQTLDEVVASSRGDSPREVARRVIAARKRQAKAQPAPKPAPVTPLTLGLGMVDTEPAAESPKADVPASAMAAETEPREETRLEPSAQDEPAEKDLAPAAESIALEPAHPKAAEVPASSAIETAEPAEAVPAALHLDSAAPVDIETASSIGLGSDPIVAPMPVGLFGADRDSEHHDSGEEAGEPGELPLARDHQERIVTVDEFRARESAGTRPDRFWPRASDHAAPDRVTMPKTPPVDALDAELPPPVLDDGSAQRPRIVMLPLAVMLIVGLLLGFTAGRLVGSRNQAAQVAQSQQAAPPTPALQTPGTTGQTPPKEFSEQAVAPSRETTPPPVAVPDEAPRTPAPRAAAGTNARPAAAAAPRKAESARATGRLVVTSTPPRAGVTVNKKWRGRTPLTLDGMAFGRYDVRIVEPGYQVAREQLTLSQKAPTGTMSATLKANKAAASAPASAPSTAAKPPAVAAMGTIYVDSRPRGARVVIDGKEHGVTPLTVPNQAAGEHVVRIEMADHAPFTKTETVKAGVTSRVTGSLERIR